MVVDVAELRDHISDFDDFLRPLRNYLYWEPHCADIPVCWSMRSVFDGLDGVDTLTDSIQQLMPDMHRLDELMPQMATMMQPQIETMRTMKTMMLTMNQTQKGLQDQMAEMQDNQTAMGTAFNDSKNDDTLLSSTGDLQQRRLQARHEELHLLATEKPCVSSSLTRVIH